MIPGFFAAAYRGGGGRRWTPAEISTWPWYSAKDADSLTLAGGNSIAQWRDKSGHGIHLSPATEAPAYSVTGLNGYPAASFNGVNQGFRAALGSAFLANVPGVSVFAVGTVDAAADGLDYLLMVPFSSGGAKLTMDVGRSSRRVSVGGRRVESDGFQTVTGATTVAATPQIHGAVLDYSSAGGSVWLNGVEDASGSFQSAGASSGADSQSLSVGCAPDNLNWWRGLVSEVVVLPVAVAADSATRQRVEGYLAWEYDLQDRLSPTHPFRHVPPYV